MHTSSHPQPRHEPDMLPESADSLRLVRLCSAHLDREQAHLETTREVLRKVYAAARASKPQELSDLLERQKNVAEATAGIRAERERFRAEAGCLMGIAVEAVTVGEIARRLPAGIAQHVLERRRQLQRLAGEVESLGRDVALFGHYFLDFLQRFFVQLTGGRNSGRYGPEGRRREPVCGSLLQAQG
jgi:hypothetical protein